PVHVAPDAARFLSDQPTEISGLAVQSKERNEPVEGIDAFEGGPLAQRLDLTEALPDATTHSREVAAAVPFASGGQTVECCAERVAGRKEHAELLADDR